MASPDHGYDPSYDPTAGWANDPDGYAEKMIEVAKQFPRYDIETLFQYGTAGFRMHESKLDFVVAQVGVLAGLRSRKYDGQTIGIMITASHNKAEDNGVKLVDPQGEMLEQQWEKYATHMVNAMNPTHAGNSLLMVAGQVRVDLKKPAHVIFARDTRPSGTRLVKALRAALDATGVSYIDYGILTTPQLHYLVKATNTQKTNSPYGEVSEEGYYKKLSEAFKECMRDGVKAQGPVTVDCANGVGAPQLEKLIEHIPSDMLKIRVVNDDIDNPAVLNERCGADFVKTSQMVPSGFNGKTFDRWAAYDGDADRIVYFFNQEGTIFRLLDGDRIATLAASFIGELVQKAGLSEKIQIAVVQTAYANGSSTKYIQEHLKLKTEFTPTGVKHLHHAATRFDIGVYFEANGHGTILFSPKTEHRIQNHEVESPAQADALKTLQALVNLINQTVGDAMSDMLLVEVILAHREFTVKEWAACYRDLPNQIGKVFVNDKRSFVTKEGTAERELEKPAGMQEELNKIIAKYPEARAFVRASGTEDAVRIYAEAGTTFDLNSLARELWEHVERRCGQTIWTKGKNRDELGQPY